VKIYCTSEFTASSSRQERNYLDYHPAFLKPACEPCEAEQDFALDRVMTEGLI